MRRRLLTVLVVTVAGASALAQHAFGGVVVNERFSLTQFVGTCSNELFQVEVDIHQVNRITTDAQGVEHIGVTFTSSFRATSPGGDRYIGLGRVTSEIRDGDTGATAGTFTNSLRVILRGEDGGSDDQTFKSILHFTFNANGELVASQFRVTFDCS